MAFRFFDSFFSKVKMYKRVQNEHSPLSPIAALPRLVTPKSVTVNQFLSPSIAYRLSDDRRFKRRSFTPLPLNLDMTSPKLSPIRSVVSSSQSEIADKKKIRRNQVDMKKIRRDLKKYYDYSTIQNPNVTVSNYDNSPTLSSPVLHNDSFMNARNDSLLNANLSVHSVLKEIGMEKYEEKFFSEEIDLFTFSLLTAQDLDILGVDEADQEVLMEAVCTYEKMLVDQADFSKFYWEEILIS